MTATPSRAAGKTGLAALLCSLAGLLQGSGALAAEGCDSLRGLPINFAVDWQVQIKPIINELFETGRCTSCHNGGQLDGGLDLTDEGIDALYKIVPAYVDPGRPEQSLLLQKVNCAIPPFGARMPFESAPLSLAQQGLIYDWIAQGALGDDPDEPPIPRQFVFRDSLESLR